MTRTSKMLLASIVAVLLAAAVRGPVLAGSAPSATTTSTSSPSGLVGPAPFTDTFAGSTAAAPLYGLNASLDARQSGTVSSYTRVSGLWNSNVAPAASYVQAHPGAHPNTLAFYTGTSAVMLDTPVIADTGGHYTVSTTIDPVVNDTSSDDWGSLVFSRSRMSAGYITNSDVDLGLIIRSSGAMTLFNAGVAFWSGSVPAAAAYAVSITVSTNADKTVALVVNGSTWSVAGPASLLCWPSLPYLYLGAYLSATGEVTTFGSGQPGQGLSVSHVDTAIAGNSRIFVDTFDGASDSTTTGNGLNNGLRARQPGVVSSGYTRLSGQSSTTTAPAAARSQVNQSSYPGKLSFWTGNSAVQLAKPVTAGLDGSYSIHAVLDPVASKGDTTSADWLSMVLSATSGTSGSAVATNTSFALTLRSNGRLQVYQKGVAIWPAEKAIPMAADGSFDVTLTVFSDAAKTVDLSVNGVVLTVATTANLPRTAYLALGSQIGVSTEVSTVDDLRVSQLGGLTDYGYYDVLDPTDSVDHSSAIAGYTNMNLYLAGVDTGALDYCRPQSCIISIQWQQFQENAPATGMEIRPDAVTQLNLLKASIASDEGKLGAIYLIDEPYTASSQRNVSAADLQTATNQAVQAFPGKTLMLNLDGASVTGNHNAIPPQIDMIGFDWYCVGATTIHSTVTALEARLSSPYQRLFLDPESAVESWCPNATDTSLSQTQTSFAQLAASDPRIGFLMNFGWWLGGQSIGDPAPFTDLPQTAKAQQTLGASIIGVG